MKKIALLAFVALTFNAHAQNAAIALGTQELRLAGGLDFDTAAGTDLSLDAGYGYFIADFLEVGGLFGFGDNDDVFGLSLGGFTEYNFDTESSFIPFVGGQIELAYYDFDAGGDDTALVLGLYGGGKFFLTGDLAINTRLIIEVATEEVYPDGNGLDDVDTRIDLGLSYYY